MKIIIPGNPIPKARHRHSGTRSYDPQSEEKKACSFWMQEEYARQLSDAFDSEDKEVVLIASRLSLADAFDVKMTFYMPIPESFPKRKKRAIAENSHSDPVFHVSKPDCSNIIKFYEDAANGILWTDDSQIVHLEAWKFYSSNPRTEIEFHEAAFNIRYSDGKINC